MNFCTPEQAGISSSRVLDFLRSLDDWRLSTHSILLARGDKIFTECYWAPFDKDFKHRMYSTSKSMVSVAVGFCVQDGLVSLDDPMAKYFPEYAGKPVMPDTTVREMLQMKTTREGSLGWFKLHAPDRAALYFEQPGHKHAGTLFSYDSQGTFMLGALVENVTGKPFMDYLKEKVFNDIGAFEGAYCLTCPGGHSWGDSGVMCTSRDLWHFARFVLNGGAWGGKQYLNKAFLDEAVKTTVPNNPYGFRDHHDTNGYGYQFWGTHNGCFATLGMGGQVSVCDPKTDTVFVMTADNQGNPNAYEQVFTMLHAYVLDHLGDPLPEDPAAKAELDAYIATRKLFCLPKAPVSPFAEKIAGKVFDCEPSQTGIKWFRLDFDGNEGSFTYENAQGEKRFSFGFGHNVFAKFPEEGYSDTVGNTFTPGHYYDAAFSADWPDERTLRVRVQIIDKYFGNLSMMIGWRNEKIASIRFTRKAEDFLHEYDGLVNAAAR